MKRHLRDKARSSPGTPEVAPRSGSVTATELLVLALFVLLTKAFLLSNLVVLFDNLHGLLPVEFDKGDLNKGGHSGILVLFGQSKVGCGRAKVIYGSK